MAVEAEGRSWLLDPIISWWLWWMWVMTGRKKVSPGVLLRQGGFIGPSAGGRVQGDSNRT